MKQKETIHQKQVRLGTLLFYLVGAKRARSKWYSNMDHLKVWPRNWYPKNWWPINISYSNWYPKNWGKMLEIPMLLEMPLVAATSSDVLSHAVMTVQCWRQPFNRRDVSCSKRDWPRSPNAHMLRWRGTVPMVQYLKNLTDPHVIFTIRWCRKEKWYSHLYQPLFL